MKYIIPEINISKFSVENIVTESAVTNAENAINAAFGTGATNTTIVKTTLDEWIGQ